MPRFHKRSMMPKNVSKGASDPNYQKSISNLTGSSQEAVPNLWVDPTQLQGRYRHAGYRSLTEARSLSRDNRNLSSLHRIPLES